MLILGGIRKQLCSKVRYMWDISRCIYASERDWWRKMKTPTYRRLLLRGNLSSWLGKWTLFSPSYWHLKQTLQKFHLIHGGAICLRCHVLKKLSNFLSLVFCHKIKQWTVVIMPVKCMLGRNEAKRPSLPQQGQFSKTGSIWFLISIIGLALIERLELMSRIIRISAQQSRKRDESRFERAKLHLRSLWLNDTNEICAGSVNPGNIEKNICP